MECLQEFYGEETGILMSGSYPGIVMQEVWQVARVLEVLEDSLVMAM